MCPIGLSQRNEVRVSIQALHLALPSPDPVKKIVVSEYQAWTGHAVNYSYTF